MVAVRKLSDEVFELDLEGVRTVTFKLDDEILREIDEMTRKLGYSNRSELIRDAVEEYIQFLKEESEKQG